MNSSNNRRGVAFRVPIADASHFEREGFSGDVFVNAEDMLGFEALQVTVHGRHPRKQILDGNTRSYYVVKGEGIFVIDGTAHDVSAGDLFVLPSKSEYEYSGEMTLFEFNVSPDNSFGDKKLE